MTLQTLLDRCGVDRANRLRWFCSATLVGQTLLVSDIDEFATVERCWLPELRRVMPTLSVTFAPSSKPAPLELKPKPSLWKKGSPPHQRDML